MAAKLKDIEDKSADPKFLEIKEGDDIRARAAEANVIYEQAL